MKAKEDLRRKRAARRSSNMSVQGASKHDSYKFDGEDSKMHFERRSSQPSSHQWHLESINAVIVFSIAIVLALLAGAMNAAVYRIHSYNMMLVDFVMWPKESDTPQTAAGFLVYFGTHLGLIIIAALLTMWVPLAANSGLPKLKSFLNGTYVRGGIFKPKTLFAKVIGITLVVASGLPLGKEGPMVHIGAMIAAIFSCGSCWPGAGKLLELRLPQPQREWIGMGAAAGVAAAFNAPFGGILYSFEEVCSHWTHTLTWRSFFCCMLVSMFYAMLVEYSDGEVPSGIATGIKLQHKKLWSSGAFVWVILVGAIGGAVGAMYNKVVEFMNLSRKSMYDVLLDKFLSDGQVSKAQEALGERSFIRRNRSSSIATISRGGGPPPQTLKAIHFAEAVITAAIMFSLYFLVPLAISCTPCPMSAANESNASIDTNGRRAAEVVLADGCTYTGHIPHIRHSCPDGEFNELATLLLSGQEGMLNHLLSRRPAHIGQEKVFDLSITNLTIFLCFYFAVASLSFGISLPAGNFVPGIAIGATIGRIIGQVLVEFGINGAWHPGAYALLGAAAVLSGMTRMTLTLAAILIEVADDIRLMPAIMLSLSIAHMVAERFGPSIDDLMMKLQGLPFLHESPPTRLHMLTAQDAMASPVLVVPEVVQVAFLADVLDNSTHNGFPVLKVQDGQHTTKMGAKFCGMILRRQLLVLLKERVFDYQLKNTEIPPAVIEQFVGSFSTMSNSENKAVAQHVKLSASDKAKLLDLRAFMDPSPLTINKLMPLSRVYRLFNEIGVRHLPILDSNSHVVGMITRQNLHAERMEENILNLEDSKLSTDAIASSIRRTKGDGSAVNTQDSNIRFALDVRNGSSCKRVSDALSSVDGEDYGEVVGMSHSRISGGDSGLDAGRFDRRTESQQASFRGNNVHPSLQGLAGRAAPAPPPRRGGDTIEERLSREFPSSAGEPRVLTRAATDGQSRSDDLMSA